MTIAWHQRPLLIFHNTWNVRIKLLLLLCECFAASQLHPIPICICFDCGFCLRCHRFSHCVAFSFLFLLLYSIDCNFGCRMDMYIFLSDTGSMKKNHNFSLSNEFKIRFDLCCLSWIGNLYKPMQKYWCHRSGGTRKDIDNGNNSTDTNNNTPISLSQSRVPLLHMCLALSLSLSLHFLSIWLITHLLHLIHKVSFVIWFIDYSLSHFFVLALVAHLFIYTLNPFYFG